MDVSDQEIVTLGLIFTAQGETGSRKYLRRFGQMKNSGNTHRDLYNEFPPQIDTPLNVYLFSLSQIECFISLLSYWDNCSSVDLASENWRGS